MKSRKIRWKRLLIVAAGALGLLLVCCTAVWAVAPNLRRILSAQYWKTDPQLAAQAARSLVDYDLPPNYQELKVLRIQDSYAAVIIAHRERPDDLIFMGTVLEGVIGVEAWRIRYEQDLSQEIGDRRYNNRVVGTREMTVRGQPVTLRLFEGSDEAGRSVRQIVCAFKGKGGDMLLAIVADTDTWDQSMFDNFLGSIR